MENEEQAQGQESKNPVEKVIDKSKKGIKKRLKKIVEKLSKKILAFLAKFPLTWFIISAILVVAVMMKAFSYLAFGGENGGSNLQELKNLGLDLDEYGKEMDMEAYGIDEETLRDYKDKEIEAYERIFGDKVKKVTLSDGSTEYYIEVTIEKTARQSSRVISETSWEEDSNGNIIGEKQSTSTPDSSFGPESPIPVDDVPLKIRVKDIAGKYITGYELPLVFHMGTGNKKFSKEFADNMIKSAEIETVRIESGDVEKRDTISESDGSVDKDTGHKSYTTKTIEVKTITTGSMDAYIIKDLSTWAMEYTSTIDEADPRAVTKSSTSPQINRMWLDEQFQKHNVKEIDIHYALTLLQNSVSSVGKIPGLRVLDALFPEFKNGLSQAEIERNKLGQGITVDDVPIWYYIVNNGTVPPSDDDGGRDIGIGRNPIGHYVSGDILLEYLKSWENLDLFQQNSYAVGRYITADGRNYIVYEDGSRGHNNISYGLATFISTGNSGSFNHPVYGLGDYNHEPLFGPRGVDVRQLSKGSLVPREAADGVFSEIVQNNRAIVEAKVSGMGLTSHQIDALIAVMYQYGNIGNIVDAYDKCKNTDSLKTTFWVYLANGGQTYPFNVSSGTEVKRSSYNWQLFHEGIYTGRDGKPIVSSAVNINIGQDIQQLINLSDSEAWSIISGGKYTSKPPYPSSQATMDSMQENITVRIRMWENPNNPNDLTRKTVTKTIKVNKAFTTFFTNFFEDIYNQAPDFVFNYAEGYSYRCIEGTNTISAHSFGTTIDINPDTPGNGYWQWSGTRKPYTKAEWEALPNNHTKYETIYEGSPIVQIGYKYTLSWGGDWKGYDGMHFSFIGDETRAVLKARH